MPNADGIGQTALDGIENENFGDFKPKITQKLTKNTLKFIYPIAHLVISFMATSFISPKHNQMVELIDYFFL